MDHSLRERGRLFESWWRVCPPVRSSAGAKVSKCRITPGSDPGLIPSADLKLSSFGKWAHGAALVFSRPQPSPPCTLPWTTSLKMRPACSKWVLPSHLFLNVAKHVDRLAHQPLVDHRKHLRLKVQETGGRRKRRMRIEKAAGFLLKSNSK